MRFFKKRVNKPAPATSDRRKLGARRACVAGLFAWCARSVAERTSAEGKRWRGMARAAMRSVESGERAARRPNRKPGFSQASRKGLSVSAFGRGRAAVGKQGDGDCAPEGEKARKQGGKREPLPAPRSAPTTRPIHILCRHSPIDIERHEGCM